MSVTISNPNAAQTSNINFTDTFPTNPGAMVTSGTSYTTSGCGTPTVRAPIGGGGYVSGAASFSAANITIAANSSCTISLPVTAPVAGPPTYDNTTSHIYVGTVDTTKFASASLTVNSTPPTPTCVSTQVAQWTFPTGFNLTNPIVDAGSLVTATAQIGAGLTLTAIQGASTHTADGTYSWGSNGGFDGGNNPLNTANNRPYRK